MIEQNTWVIAGWESGDNGNFGWKSCGGSELSSGLLPPVTLPTYLSVLVYRWVCLSGQRPDFQRSLPALCSSSWSPVLVPLSGQWGTPPLKKLRSLAAKEQWLREGPDSSLCILQPLSCSVAFRALPRLGRYEYVSIYKSGGNNKRYRRNISVRTPIRKTQIFI